MDNLEPHLQHSKNIQSILLYPKEGMEIKPLLPTGSEKRGVFEVGSIPVAILLSCQNMKIIALQLHNMNIAG